MEKQRGCRGKRFVSIATRAKNILLEMKHVNSFRQEYSVVFL